MRAVTREPRRRIAVPGRERDDAAGRPVLLEALKDARLLPREALGGKRASASAAATSLTLVEQACEASAALRAPRSRHTSPDARRAGRAVQAQLDQPVVGQVSMSSPIVR